MTFDFLAALWVTPAGIVFVTLITISLLGLRLADNHLAGVIIGVWVPVLRNAPSLMQLMFWYLAVWSWLPRDVISLTNADHP